jgi:ribosomal subunit interface protein
MHITVAGKQVETGEALQVHVRDGLSAIARKYFDHALEANVTFGRDHRAFFTCDINLKAGRNLFMRGEGEAADAHRAFEVAAEHLAKRLRRYRRRVNDHARSLAESRDSLAGPGEIARQVVLRPEDEEQEGAPAHGTIVAEHQTMIDRLSVSEAVMRLDLTHAPAMMFRNSASGVLNVVYRRPDGNIGWIDAPGDQARQP